MEQKRNIHIQIPYRKSPPEVLEDCLDSYSKMLRAIGVLLKESQTIISIAKRTGDEYFHSDLISLREGALEVQDRLRMHAEVLNERNKR